MGDGGHLDLAWLRHALLEEVTLGDRMETLVAQVAFLLDNVHVGVSVVRRGAYIAVSSMNPVFTRLHQVQRDFGSGPDLALMADRALVQVEDIGAFDEWQPWALQAERCGLRSMIGVPLPTLSGPLGTLTCYAAVPGRFGSADAATLSSVARHAAPVLAGARERDRLWEALESRRMIGLAQGVLMESDGVDRQEAAEVLSRRSRDRHLPQNALAGQLVADMASHG
jgi:GAF domain-containing protein